MADVPFITAASVEHRLGWLDMVEALETGHYRWPRAMLRDQVIARGSDRILSRCAWIGGQGMAVKTVTIMPENAPIGLPTVQGAVTIFGDATGEVTAVIDGALVTKWKTTADSLLGAKILAAPDPRRILVVGCGVVGRAMAEGYSALYPDARISIWNRTAAKAEVVARQLDCDVATDLKSAVTEADIVSVATMATEPIILGAWLRPGQHIDVIGAFDPVSRETDDEALRRSRVFVDCYETTVDQIGELRIPIANGVITEEEVLGDLYELTRGAFGRKTPEDITLFKNGGGAHLDLMISRAIMRAYQAR